MIESMEVDGVEYKLFDSVTFISIDDGNILQGSKGHIVELDGRCALVKFEKIKKEYWVLFEEIKLN